MAKAKKEETKVTEIAQDAGRLDDAVELSTVRSGEYKVRLLQINEGIDKNGSEYVQPRLEIANDLYTKDFTYFIGLPGPYDDAKQMNKKKLKINDFCLAFGTRMQTISEFKELCKSGDLIGMEAWAVLKEKESDEYGMQNEIVRFIKPV